MKIGVGITAVQERRSVFIQSLEKQFEHLPKKDVQLYIHVDDEKNGVAYSKNKCLSELRDCDHIFLFDDDTYPIADNWWKPYAEHPEPHLLYQFKLPGKPKSDMKELYRDEKTVAYSHTRGAMIYIERRVLDVVGGFDVAYGLGGFEHPDFTNRIHNAGLTTHRAMDVPNSDKLLYCLDQDGLVESTLKGKGNYSLYRKNRESKEFKEFRS